MHRKSNYVRSTTESAEVLVQMSCILILMVTVKDYDLEVLYTIHASKSLKVEVCCRVEA